MKISISLLVTAALLPVAGFALAAPSVNPARGGYDGSGPIFNKEWQAKTAEAGQLGHDAAVGLRLGNYAQAVAEAREALSLNPGDGVAAEVLAAALEGQGKDREALAAYQTVVEHHDKHPRNLLPYAQLLLRSGKWAEALAVYNQALPLIPDVGTHPESPVVHDEDLMRANSRFSTDEPDPAALATALHIARGIVYNDGVDWVGGNQHTKAMEEYKKAFQLAPNNALTNYFYSIGWQKLSPTERTKFGTVQQAKAHLQKAVKTGNANVKAAAQKALKELG